MEYKRPENFEDILKLQKHLDDILNCYWEKWQKNMQRIGKEWD